ncbi:MucBP domain-containing protein, partial [Enterococcus faecalis]|nr:MucBP domain-containing protein [Enterococcus faecalis]
MKKNIFKLFLSICLLLSFFILIPKFSHAASGTGRLFIQVQDSETYAGIEGAYFTITSIESPTNEILVKTDVNGQINEEFMPGNYMIKQLSTTDKDENYTYTSIGFSRLIEAGRTVNIVGFENKLSGSYIFSGSLVEVHVPLNSKFDAADQGIIAFKLNQDGTLGAQLTSAWLYPYYNNVNTSIPGEYVSIYKGYQTSFNKSTSHVLKVIVDPEPPIIAAPVIIKYEDEVGNELASSETLNGKVGLPYETKAKSINGWTVKTTPDNATGTF